MVHGSEISDEWVAERPLPCHHLVQDYTQRPDVHWEPVLLVLEDFWCHVAQASQHGAG